MEGEGEEEGEEEEEEEGKTKHCANLCCNNPSLSAGRGQMKVKILLVMQRRISGLCWTKKRKTLKPRRRKGVKLSCPTSQRLSQRKGEKRRLRKRWQLILKIKQTNHKAM